MGKGDSRVRSGIPERVSRLAVGNRDCIDGREELGHKHGVPEVRVGGEEIRHVRESALEVGRVERVQVRAVHALQPPLDAGLGITAEPHGADELVPGYRLHPLDGGAEVQEGLVVPRGGRLWAKVEAAERDCRLHADVSNVVL